MEIRVGIRSRRLRAGVHEEWPGEARGADADDEHARRFQELAARLSEVEGFHATPLATRLMADCTR